MHGVKGGNWCTMDMVSDFGRMLSCTTDSSAHLSANRVPEDAHSIPIYYVGG
jgi:hypothetical protein